MVMESVRRTFIFSLITIITLLSLSSTLSLSFTPIDNYLIDCGSGSAITVDSDNRVFSGDSVSSNSVILKSGRTVSISDPNPASTLSPIYHTARVFKSSSRYEFLVRERGTHILRLHFHRLDYPICGVKSPLFHVSANGVLLMRNFTGHDNANDPNPRIKEYLMWVDTDKVVIRFTPSQHSSYGYVNAIEVIAAPTDLVADTAQFVNSDGIEKFDGLSKQALETLYRVNVGGPKVTPFNDSLWRNWIPDDGFLKSSDNRLKRVYFSGRIKYQLGGASREVAPDNVYNTARVVASEDSSIPNLNMSYSFPVVEGYKYLVRMHFCDISSVSLGMLYFNVYVNGHLAYYNLDMSSLTNSMLASPFYADFVVDGDHSGLLNISVGPSNMSVPHTADAILNGVEIMKMNNSMGSLDGNLSAKMFLKKDCWEQHFGFSVSLLAFMCLMLAAYMSISRGLVRMRNSVTWTPLSVDVSEDSLKYRNQELSAKV